jgi:hypothetical protein
VVKALVNGEKAQTQCLTVDQVFAEEIKGTNPKLWRTPSVAEEKNQNTSTQIYLQNQVGATPKVWRTPSSSDGEGGVMEMREGCAGKYKLRDHVVAEQKAWATPRAGKTTDENPETWALRQAKGDVATMPLTAQVKAWATPCSRDHHPNGQADGSKTDLGNQVTKQWGTPTARDHKSGRGNEEREYKELTPMVERTQAGKLNPRWVETLMGLPVGWVMPSCASPVTIAPTNCDSWATESFQQQPSELFEC